MALTPGAAVRTDDSSGLNIKTFVDAGSAHSQGVALVDDNGDHCIPESWYDTDTTLDEAVNIKASAGRLFQVRVCSQHSSDVWLQFFNEADAVPSTDPLMRVLLPANGYVSVDLGLHGRYFSTGILIAPSSTLATYTAISASDFAYSVGYK